MAFAEHYKGITAMIEKAWKEAETPAKGADMDGNDIIPYIEPIFRFCYRRLNSRYDAQDLASEILCHILDGMGRYKIESLEAWVWRIAHNRYARFVEARRKRMELLSDQELTEADIDYRQIDEASVEDEFQPVFLCLHRLSSEYRNIFVDYYIGELSVKQLSRKYRLPETTVKWRLNVGRSKIREWIGEGEMEKVYQRINWNTTGCNGRMHSDRYLHTQIARAICQAAYEKPLTVEEISQCTGIPAMYIEDELPRLEYGDAVRKIGNKYAADFIIVRLEDRAKIESACASMIKEIADYYEEMLWGKEEALEGVGFYGCKAGMGYLGHVFLPYFIRKKIRDLKNGRLNLPDGDFPPRKDGGCGWFHIQETEDEREMAPDSGVGCSLYKNEEKGTEYYLCYYPITKYFNQRVFDIMGSLKKLGIGQTGSEGWIPEGVLQEDELLRFLEARVIRKEKDGYWLNFPCFTGEQFRKASELLCPEDQGLDDLLSDWILSVRKSFTKFVPQRLEDQINQWVSTYAHEIISYVTEELISRGRLERPDPEGNPICGIFGVYSGK